MDGLLQFLLVAVVTTTVWSQGENAEDSALQNQPIGMVPGMGGGYPGMGGGYPGMGGGYPGMGGGYPGMGGGFFPQCQGQMLPCMPNQYPRCCYGECMRSGMGFICPRMTNSG